MRSSVGSRRTSRSSAASSSRRRRSPPTTTNRVALPRRRQLRRAALRRRVAGDQSARKRHLPRQRTLARYYEFRRRQDVHLGQQGSRWRIGGLRAVGQGAHLRARPPARDAAHHRHARDGPSATRQTFGSRETSIGMRGPRRRRRARAAAGDVERRPSSLGKLPHRARLTAARAVPRRWPPLSTAAESGVRHRLFASVHALRRKLCVVPWPDRRVGPTSPRPSRAGSGPTFLAAGGAPRGICRSLADRFARTAPAATSPSRSTARPPPPPRSAAPTPRRPARSRQAPMLARQRAAARRRARRSAARDLPAPSGTPPAY